MRIRHVILDRDGVLNVEQAGGGWLSDWSQWRWLPGATEGLRALTAAGMRVSIATNQSGIGRGLVARNDVDALHARMIADAASEGGTIDRVFVCPHAPDERCACRKPGSGLFLEAIAASGVPAGETMALGDDLRDLQAAWSAGVSAALVRTGKGRPTEANLAGQPVPVYDDLRDFAGAVVAAAVPPANQGLLIAHRIFREHAAVVRAAAELVGRFRRERRALAALALTADTMILTALANDYGYDRVFARQVEALGQPGDVLAAFSTSGNSANVIQAAQIAHATGCKVLAFTGQGGGALAAHADVLLQVPSADVARIQEVHDMCIHALAEAVEDSISRNRTA